jgi:hypothetical protein
LAQSTARAEVRFLADFVEKLRLMQALGADSVLLGAQEIRRMIGERRVMQEALFYGFSLEELLTTRRSRTPGRRLRRALQP